MRQLKNNWIWTLTLFPASIYSCISPEVWSGGGTPGDQWNVSANWDPSCVPAGTSMPDTAVFNSTIGPAGPIIYLSNPTISPILETLNFHNSTTSYTLSTSTMGMGAQYIEFESPATFLEVTAGNHMLNVPIHFLRGTNLTFNIVSSSSLTIGKGALSDGGSESITATGDGTLTLLNKFDITGNFTSYITHLNIFNATSPGMGLIGSALLAPSGTFTLKKGTVTCVNESAATISSSDTYGTFVQVGNYVQNGGTFISENAGAVSENATGSLLEVANRALISSGTTKMINSGTVSGAIGSKLDLTGITLQMTGGSLTSNNTGTISEGGIGCLIQCANISMTGGTLTNNGPVITSSSGYGNLIVAELLASTISGGVFTNNDTFQGTALQITRSGVLQGTGVFQGVGGAQNLPVTNDATVAPGDTSSVGTMTINGSYTQNSTGTFILNIDSASSYSHLVVSSTSPSPQGTATINGGTLEVNIPDVALLNGTTFTFLTANNGVAGSFTDIIVNNSRYKNASIASTSDSFLLSFGSYPMVDGIFTNNDIFQGAALEITSTEVLQGTGIFQGIDGAQNLPVTNDATVAPGSTSSVGTMTINGSYMQNSTGTFILNIDSATSYSQLVVSSTGPSPEGTATINGGTLEVNIPDVAFPPGTTFTFLTANNGVAGNFTDIVVNNPHFKNAFITSTNDSFILSFDPMPTPPSDFPTHKIAHFASVIFSNLYHINQMIEEHIFQMNHQISKNDGNLKRPSAAKYAANVPMEDLIALSPKRTSEKQQTLIQEIQSPPIPYPLTIYFGPIGTLGNYLTKHGQEGFRYWTGGAMLGFNYAFSEFGIGSSLTYEHTHEKIKHHGGHSDTDEVDLFLYGSYVPRSLPQFAATAIVGGGYQWNSFPRVTGFNNDLVDKGFPRGWDFTSTLGVQYTFMNPPFSGLPCGFQFVPLADVQYCYLSIDGYREHRAGMFDLRYKEQHTKSLKLDLGFLANYTFVTPTTTIRPQLTLKYRREFLYKREKTVSRLVNLDKPYVTSYIKAPNLNTAEATFDLLTMFYGRYGIDIFYNFEWNSWFHDHTAYVNGTFSF